MTRDTDERPETTDATAADAAADAATGAANAATETADAAATPGPTAGESDANSMGDVDHTHPHGNTTFGSIFGRGPTVAADGGEPSGARRSSSERGSDGGAPAATQDDTSMREVSHESPTGTDPNAAFERGGDVADGRRGVRTDE